MNKKSYSILFCALLASTLVHELRAKSVAPLNSINNEGLEVVRRSKRDTPAELLSLNLQVVGSVLIVVNVTASAALLIDIEARVFLLLNGTTGSGVCVDPASKKGAYIEGGLWNATEGSLEEFLDSLEDGIEGLLESVDAILFKLGKVAKNILQEVTNIVVCLVAIIDVELNLNLSLALNLVLSLVDGILELVGGVLEGLLELIGSVVIELSVDICGLLHVLQGLGEIIELVAGSLSACVQLGVEFDLSQILGAVDGLVCLVNIILQLGVTIVLTALADLLGSVDSLFYIITKLGGCSPIGITGVFGVVGEIVALLQGNATLESVISRLVQYVAYSSIYVDVDLSVELNATLNVLLDVLVQVNATVVLSGLVDIVESLLDGTLEVLGCNLSGIIFKLLAGVLGTVQSLLVLIVQILLLIVGQVVNLVTCLTYLLLILICKLASPCGVYQLLALGIKLPNSLLGLLAGLLKAILLSVKNLLSLLNGNLYDALVNLNVIGDIVKALDSAIKTATNGEVSLKKLLNASSLVQGLIKALFKLVTGLPIIVSGVLFANIKIILNVVTNVSVFLGINIVAIVSVG